MQAIGNIFKSLKGTVGETGKAIAVEMYLEMYHGEFINNFRKALMHIKVEDVPLYIYGKKPLPIPPNVWSYAKGFEKQIERIKIERILEWIAEARPEIAKAIMAEGSVGYLYLRELKKSIIQAVENAPPLTEVQQQQMDQALGQKPEEKSTENIPMTEVTCDACGYKFTIPTSEKHNIKECPSCGEPA